MDPKKKVSDIIKGSGIKVVDFVRYKVGEGSLNYELNI